MLKFILILGATLSFAGFLLTAYNGLVTTENVFYLSLMAVFFYVHSLLFKRYA